MSDFPNPTGFSTRLSGARIRYLKIHSLQNLSLQNSESTLVIKKEKDQFIYDIDDNKYVDFSLCGGTALCGHNFKTLTRYIKNGISAGTSNGRIDKFRYQLVRLFKSIADFEYVSFYGSFCYALVTLARSLGAARVGVSSSYLMDLALKALPGISVEIATDVKEYDLLLFEPLDFDRGLKPFDHSAHKAVFKCSVETRTAFRIQKCFSKNLEEIPFILCGPVIANGMDCAVIISRKMIEGENIPAYKSAAILETVKYYLRNNDLYEREYKIRDCNSRGGIFKVGRPFEPAALLKYGVILDSDTGFICLQHTENDIKRLERALDGVKFTAEMQRPQGR